MLENGIFFDVYDVRFCGWYVIYFILLLTFIFVDFRMLCFVGDWRDFRGNFVYNVLFFGFGFLWIDYFLFRFWTIFCVFIVRILLLIRV